MAQSFLTSAAARTLSVLDIGELSEAQAFAAFVEMRFHKTGGKPACIWCGHEEVYWVSTRRIYKCKSKSCHRQFSPTSRTIFASRKLPYKKMLALALLFVNAANGVPGLRLCREVNVCPKTAHVFGGKVREALGSSLAEEKLTGEVEIDGAYMTKYVRPFNSQVNNQMRAQRNREHAKALKDWTRGCARAHQLGLPNPEKPKILEAPKTIGRKPPRYKNTEPGSICVFVMRERAGKALAFVVPEESHGVPLVEKHADPSAIIFCDGEPSWNSLSARFKVERVHHNKEYSRNGVTTNFAESYFTRFRRATRGVHLHLSHHLLQGYVNEWTWRENNRRISNGAQWDLLLRSASSQPVSRHWKGYWQRHQC